jgi:hypothetical protein
MTTPVETYPAIRRTLAAMAGSRPRGYSPVDVAELRQLLAERDRLAAAPGQYLIWSNQKGMWWRPAECGYTQIIYEAGLYESADAERLLAKATCDGQLVHTRVDPVTGRIYLALDEVLVPAWTQKTEADGWDDACQDTRDAS